MTAPRYQGRISTWKDEQGFGFISPNGGGPAVFVHVSAFAGRGQRPAVGALVTYHLGANARGPCAEQVAFARNRATRETTPRGRTAALIAAAGFLVFVGACVITEKLPALVLGLYAGASSLTFLAYALDKSAARKGAWRTKENTLHLFALLGGWPGALVAQQVLRHKSRKTSFRAGFWVTVVVNCGVLAWYLSGAA